MNRLVNKHITVTVESLMNKCTAVEEKIHTLIEAFEHENKHIKSLVELETKVGSCINNVKKYLLFQYNLTEINIIKIDYQSVIDLDYYLRSKKGNANNSTIRIIKTLQQIVKTTLDKGLDSPYF